MLLDFTTMELTEIAAFKGGEGSMFAKMHADSLGKIIRATLEKGSTVGLHTHETNYEVIFVLAGEADHIVDGVTEHLSAGMCGYCPKGSAHTLITTSEKPLEFFAVVPEA